MTTEAFLNYLHENLLKKSRLNISETEINQWVYEPGIPEGAPEFDSERFDKVEMAVEQWKNGKRASELDTDGWSSHEWLHFIRNLPKEMSDQQMEELDEVFGFTTTGNSEMLVAWLVHAVREDYKKAFDKLDEFLTSTGRRKFLVPLYGELTKTEAGTKRAMLIYQKARDNYHYVSVHTIDEMLSWKTKS